MPRLHGYRERRQRDIHTHIHHLDQDTPFSRVFGVSPDDTTGMLVNVRASTPDVTITFGVAQKVGLAIVTGPALVGDGTDSTVLQLLQIANDAVQEGRALNALEVIQQMLERKVTNALLRPVIVPVRQEWRMHVTLNDGATPGPVDIWLTMLDTRDVA